MNTEVVSPRPPRSIPVRHPKFRFEPQGGRHWLAGDPVLTHFVQALSLTFPEGEAFFMDSVAHFRRRIQEPTLRHEVARFLAQEAVHGKEHRAFNAWFSSQGFDTEALERRIRDNLARARELPPLHRLAITCALEHFTAIMAEQILDNPELLEQFDPGVRQLWRWHAVEEAEHKSVAFDVYEAMGGRYPRRVIVMLVVTAQFIFQITRIQAALIRQDPEAQGAGKALGALWVQWGNPGWLRRLVPAYLDYFRTGFHPWDRPASEGLARAQELLADTVVDTKPAAGVA